MINAFLGNFLDTGWFSEATLYLNGYTYWCEGNWNNELEHPMHFFVYKYKSIIHKKGEKTWTSRMIENGNVVDYSIVFDIRGDGEDDVKERFLSAKIFEGKTFWEVEKEIAWYDEY